MKVAQILFSGLGGHGSVAFSLVAGDRDRAWTNAFLFLGTEPVLEEYRLRCDASGIDQSYIQARAGKPWLNWLPLYRQLLRDRPDAIINHSLNVLIPGWLAAKRLGVPYVVVEHSPLQTKRRRDWVISRAAMRLADRVVMLTDEYKDAARDLLGNWWREDIVSTINNGIDTDRFVPDERVGETDRSIRIGMAARFSPSKRQDLLIEAVASLQNEDRGNVIALTLAGDGESLTKAQASARQYDIRSIEFAGFLDEGALIRWFGGLDIYAHYSEGETLSTSLLQAMALGLPIVASDIDGIRNQLIDETAVLVPNAEPGRWTEALRVLVQDAERRRKLGAAARRRAENVYSCCEMFRRYDAMLRTIPSRRHRP